MRLACIYFQICHQKYTIQNFDVSWVWKQYEKFISVFKDDTEYQAV